MTMFGGAAFARTGGAGIAALAVWLAVSFAALTGATLAAPSPLRLAEIASLAETDPGAALPQLRSALEESEDDPHVMLDLALLYASAAEALGETAEAAEAVLAAASIAIDQRDRLGVDPVPLIRRAAALYERAGDIRSAEAALRAAIGELEAGGLPERAKAPVLTDLARLARARGAETDALAYEQAREAALGPQPDWSAEGTRSTDDGGFRVVPVHYATDRARSDGAAPGEADPHGFYGGERGTGLEYGVATVTIPDIHEPGALEAPSIWRLEFSQNPARHVVFRSVEPVEKAAFFDSLGRAVGETPAREAFVYVHGFNQSFEKSVKRAAQIAHDMGYDGVPIAYSWPSADKVSAYVADTAAVRLSGRRLSGFLEDVAARSGATRIHLVAHSMGNRALTDALELLAVKRGPDTAPLFDQVVFAAPDVDAGLFSAMTETIAPLARRLTLYASSDDWALKVSRKLHGDAPRAGQAGDDALVAAHIDSVDMSALGEDMLAHGYFSDEASALVDLATLFWRNAPPPSRCGVREREWTVDGEAVEGGWRYDPEQCDGRTMLPLIARLRRRTEATTRNVGNLVRSIVGDEGTAARVAPDVARLLAVSDEGAAQ